MAGRKKLPTTEKKKRIWIFVKAKHHVKAKREAEAISRKYNTEPQNTPATG